MRRGATEGRPDSLRVADFSPVSIVVLFVL